eukprot:3627613-Pleurochrysis_carterae.AAC.3
MIEIDAKWRLYERSVSTYARGISSSSVSPARSLIYDEPARPKSAAERLGGPSAEPEVLVNEAMALSEELTAVVVDTVASVTSAVTVAGTCALVLVTWFMADEDVGSRLQLRVGGGAAGAACGWVVGKGRRVMGRAQDRVAVDDDGVGGSSSGRTARSERVGVGIDGIGVSGGGVVDSGGGGSVSRLGFGRDLVALGLLAKPWLVGLSLHGVGGVGVGHALDGERRLRHLVAQLDDSGALPRVKLVALVRRYLLVRPLRARPAEHKSRFDKPCQRRQILSISKTTSEIYVLDHGGTC